MPLIDLLNSQPNFHYYYGGQGNFSQDKLPYGNDQQGGGSSHEPYVTRKIGEKWGPSFDDGLIRGGVITANSRTAADIIRIGKFFGDFPKGPMFITRQIGLQLTNPKVETRDRDVFSTHLNVLGNNIPLRIGSDIGVTRVYNPLNTLAQVGGSAYGLHFSRHGLSPLIDSADKYENVVKSKNGFDTFLTDNRLIKTLNNFASNTISISSGSIIQEYKAGPGSFYGIGNTTIRRYVDSFFSIKDTSLLNGFVPLDIRTAFSIKNGVGLLFNAPSTTDTISDGPKTFDFKNRDFREAKQVDTGTKILWSDYANLNIEKRIGSPRARKSSEPRTDYSDNLIDAADKINMVSLFYANSPKNLDVIDVNGQHVHSPNIRDIIKFRIEAVDNDNPNYSVWMIFRAFIPNITETFISTWNAYQYTGRGEHFYRYQDFKNSFSINFFLHASSRLEMKPMYQKLNYLKSILTPDYNNDNKMRGSFIRLTVGDYIYRQPGIITSLEIGIDDDTTWEIALQEPEGENSATGPDTDMHELPMMLRCTLNFIPIFDFLPRKGASTPFISGLLKRDGLDPKKDWLSSGGKSIQSILTEKQNVWKK